jgi:hypothetical protein
MTRGKAFLCIVLALVGLRAAPAWCEDLREEKKPAVSEANGFLGGTFAANGAEGEHARAFLATGQYTLPIGHSLGLRTNLDVGVSSGQGTDGAEAAGGALAFFWRDPDSGFAQARGFGSHFGSVNIWGADLTAGRFLEAWDLEFGVLYLESEGGTAFSATGRFARYLNDELRLGFGLEAGSSLNPTASYGGSLNLDWQMGFARNLVLRAGGSAASIDDEAVYQVGLSVVYYFGETRVLERKIREDW